MTKAPGEVQTGFLEVQQQGQREGPVVGVACCWPTGAKRHRAGDEGVLSAGSGRFNPTRAKGEGDEREV